MLPVILPHQLGSKLDGVTPCAAVDCVCPLLCFFSAMQHPVYKQYLGLLDALQSRLHGEQLPYTLRLHSICCIYRILIIQPVSRNSHRLDSIRQIFVFVFLRFRIIVIQIQPVAIVCKSLFTQFDWLLNLCVLCSAWHNYYCLCFGFECKDTQKKSIRHKLETKMYLKGVKQGQKDNFLQLTEN